MKNHRPAGISVVIPTLNEEKNIGNTLRALRKTLPYSQVIVADGGSSDKTVAIAKKLADKVCLENGRKKIRPSIGAGRNAGARHAKHPWIVFCDADNIPPKAFFDRMKQEFSKPSVVGFGGKVMPKDATFLQNWVFEIFNLIVEVATLLGRPVIAGNAAAYKKKDFDAVGGFDEEMEASEDQDLCMRIAKRGKVVYDKNVVTYTSNRRLKKFGLAGLLWDWGKTTLNFLLGIKTKRYAIIREI
ncbi:MAG: glycosyltransferase [Candidatus Norongarragalinales archaeon]